MNTLKVRSETGVIFQLTIKQGRKAHAEYPEKLPAQVKELALRHGCKLIGVRQK